jgi:PIN domain
MATPPKLLFIDTNIWLDSYRPRNEIGLKLLERAEKIADRIIVTYQLENEFKKNRQAAILEGIGGLKVPPKMPQPGVFSEAKAFEAIEASLKEIETRVGDLKRIIVQALEEPGVHDPVYILCERVFHKRDDLTLTRDNAVTDTIRKNATRAFWEGAAPRKGNDTSIGDLFNWEWMVECASREKADLVIVSRDADYGATLDDKSYMNDCLKHEFSERVGRERSVTLYTRLSKALEHFSIKVSPQEEEAEKEFTSNLDAWVALSSETPGYIDVALRSLSGQLSQLTEPTLLRRYALLQSLGKSEKERTSKEFSDTKDEGQPGGSRHNPKT